MEMRTWGEIWLVPPTDAGIKDVEAEPGFETFGRVGLKIHAK